jgi:hypothetical protein
MAKIGVEPDAKGARAELARHLRFEKPGYGPQRVGRWLAGRARPNYEETISLLELVGWLQPDDAHATPPATSDPRLVQVFESLAAAVAALEPLVPEQELPARPGRRAPN